MTRSRRLLPVSQIAERRHQDAARTLRQSHDELQNLQARLDEVLAYRSEYLSRFQECANGGMSADQMKDFRAFLTKLDEAVAQLEALIHRSRHTCDRRRDEWMSSRTRSRALEEILTRYRKAEALEDTRREQRLNDEHTQRGLSKRR